MGKAEPILLQVMSIHVGDFQFATRARPQSLHYFEDIRGIEINPGNSVITLGLGRLLFNAPNSFVLDLGNAIALRVGDALKGDPGVIVGLSGILEERAKRIKKDVVSQND